MILFFQYRSTLGYEWGKFCNSCPHIKMTLNKYPRADVVLYELYLKFSLVVHFSSWRLQNYFSSDVCPSNIFFCKSTPEKKHLKAMLMIYLCFTCHLCL